MLLATQPFARVCPGRCDYAVNNKTNIDVRQSMPSRNKPKENTQ
jgi:hypothetical protein